jgi:hypothetical protein
MIARKQEISRQLNELIEPRRREGLVPRDPPQTSRDPPPLKSFLVFRVLIARGSLSSPMGPFLVPRWAPWPPPIKQEPEALNGDRRAFSGDFVHRRNARFPRMEESNRANVTWFSPAKLLEIQISGMVHFFSPRVGSLCEPFSCLLPKVTHISLYKHALP